MTSELGRYITVQGGLAELLQQANSMQQNLQARVDTPVLEEGTNLWSTWLDSKTIQLYGGVNADQRHVFKVDHAFDLRQIVSASISSTGSVKFEDNSVYQRSEGTEFVIVPQKDLLGAEADYALRADKYAVVREELSRGNFSVEKLASAGAFKINDHLTPEEVLNDGWKELTVGKNKASGEDYVQATALLQKYVAEAGKNKCFVSGKGMGFYVIRTDATEARLWCVCDSDCRSSASDRDSFSNDARFLRVRKKSSNDLISAQECDSSSHSLRRVEASGAQEPAILLDYEAAYNVVLSHPELLDGEKVAGLARLVADHLAK